MLVHVALGRTMDALDYAVLGSLLAMLNILNVPASAIRVALARYVAEYAHGNAVEVWVALVRRAFNRLTIFASIGLVLWCVVSAMLPGYFEEYTTHSLWMIGAVAFITLFTPIVSGTLQGARYFGWLAASGVVTAGSRLVLAVLVVMLGGGVTGVLGAVAVASLLGLLVGYLPFHQILTRTPTGATFESAPVYRYLWPVLFGQGALFILMNIDLILVTRFLPEIEFKAYQKAAILSRTVLFLPLPVALAMFPRAVNSPRRALLWGPVAFTLLVSVLAATGISLLPGLAMRLMYNVTDPLYIALAQRYVWAVVPLSLAMVLAQYLWARHQTRAILWIIPVVATYVTALFFVHESPGQIIGLLGVTGSVVVGWLLWSVIKMPATSGKK